MEPREDLMRKLLAAFLLTTGGEGSSGYALAVSVGAYTHDNWLETVWRPLVRCGYIRNPEQGEPDGWRVTPAGRAFLEGETR